MHLIDANILINAVRQDQAQHDKCLSWLDGIYRAKVPFGFTELIAVAFLRTITNHRAFADAETMEEAAGKLNDITSRREFMWLNAGHDHWSIFKRLTAVAPVKGNLVNDAWLAAIAIEGDYAFITLDRDFKRFPGLKLHNLLD